MSVRSGSVGQVSYRDSGVPCRRRHPYSGIPTLRFPLVFVVARCLVFVPSSAVRVSVMFGIPSFFRVRCYRYRLRSVACSFLVAPFLRSCVWSFCLYRSCFCVSSFVGSCSFVVIVSVVRLVHVWLYRFSVRALSHFVFNVRVLA